MFQTLPIQVLAEAHPSLARRALAMTLEENTGVTPEREAVERLLSLLKTGGSAQINGGVTVRVRHGLIEFPAEELPELPELELAEGEFTFGGARVTARIIHRRETNNLQNLSKQVLEYRLDYDKIQGKPILRGRRADDRLSLKARGCTKSLKKLFKYPVSPFCGGHRLRFKSLRYRRDGEYPARYDKKMNMGSNERKERQP